MPSYKGSATDAEMWDLANYVVSLRRKPVWEMSAAEVTAFYAQQDAEALANPVKRGEYLVDVLACPVCHSPVDEHRRTVPGMRLAAQLAIRDIRPATHLRQRRPASATGPMTRSAGHHEGHAHRRRICRSP
jgi:uncharacterized protein YbaR (Trm112 family)